MRRRRAGRPSLLGTAARTAVVAGTATAVSGNVAQKQAARQQAAAQEAAAKQAQATEITGLQAQVGALQAQASAAADPTASDGGDLIAKLQQLADMHRSGVLDDAEFAAAKAKLLS